MQGRHRLSWIASSHFLQSTVNTVFFLGIGVPLEMFPVSPHSVSIVFPRHCNTPLSFSNSLLFVLLSEIDCLYQIARLNSKHLQEFQPTEIICVGQIREYEPDQGRFVASAYIDGRHLDVWLTMSRRTGGFTNQAHSHLSSGQRAITN